LAGLSYNRLPVQGAGGGAGFLVLIAVGEKVQDRGGKGFRQAFLKVIHKVFRFQVLFFT
jgi:hypothetical protein